MFHASHPLNLIVQIHGQYVKNPLTIALLRARLLVMISSESLQPIVKAIHMPILVLVWFYICGHVLTVGFYSFHILWKDYRQVPRWDVCTCHRILGFSVVRNLCKICTS